MRKRTPNWRGYRAIPVCVLLFILAAGGTLNADSPKFDIDNSYNRDEIYAPTGETVTESYNQSYSLDWLVPVNERFDFSFALDLTLTDTHNSNSVDTKEYTPALELGFLNPIWDLTLNIENNLQETNELGVGKTEAVNIGAELNFSLTGIGVTYDVINDDQEGFEDSTQDRLEVVTDYSFSNRLAMDASFQTERFDDRLRDNSDTETAQWDFSLSYNQLLTSAIKLNIESSWAENTTDTLNNAGLVLSTEKGKSQDTSLKVALESFPNLNSDLELSNSRELVQNTEELTFTFDVETYQQILVLGTMTESFTIEINDFKSPIPQENSTERKLTFDSELSGSPSKWLDYSISDTLNFSDSQFQDSTLDTDSRDNAFDFSLTSEPTAGWTWDLAYNWQINWVDGDKTSESRGFKVNMTLEGEVLNIPNLTFNPNFDYTTDDDLESGEQVSSSSFGLDLEYTINFTPRFNVILQPAYSTEQQNGETTGEALDVDYEVGWDFSLNKWAFVLDIDGKLTDDLRDDENYITSTQLGLEVNSVIFGNVGFEFDYDYKFAAEEDSSVAVEISLDWEFLNMEFSLSANYDRTFDADENESRTYLAEFFMDF